MFPPIHSTAKSARRHPVVAALLGVLVVLASAAAVYAAVSPDFALSSQPPSQTVSSGSSATYLIMVTPTNGFQGAVTLTVGALPKNNMSSSWTVGSTSTPTTSVTLPASSDVQTAFLSVTGGQPPAGSYTITVTATSGSISHQVPLTLNVLNQNAANFQVTMSPQSLTVAQGTVSSAVSISRSGWAGPVSLGAEGLPNNATSTFIPASTSGNSSNLTIATSAATPPGTYLIDVVGTASIPSANGNGNGASGGSSQTTSATRYAALALTVLPPFRIAGNLSTPLGLGLGNKQRLNLSITNPYSTALTVSNIQVALSSIKQKAGAVGTCSQTGNNSPNFQVTNLPPTYSVTVPAHITATLTQLGTGQEPTVIWIDQPGWAQNGCLGATLGFSYSGSGRF